MEPSINCGHCHEKVFFAGADGIVRVRNMDLTWVTPCISSWWSRDLEAEVHRCHRRDGQIEVSIEAVLELMD
jgi:hypothetical protein